MPSRGKNYINATKKYDRDHLYSPSEALAIVKNLTFAKFDESVEVAVRLGIDPRKADQIVRGTVTLPAGTGKEVRVAVFAAGDAAMEARSAGADIVGADDLVTKVTGGFLDFDVAIATPELMGLVGKLGRVLGPRGLMPNPKTGTVTNDTGDAVRAIKSGRIEYRNDQGGNIVVPIGKVSFPLENLLRNARAVLDELQRAKPSAAKGKYVKAITFASTMGPGVRVDLNRIRITDDEVAAAA